jgi:hypothetical protein
MRRPTPKKGRSLNLKTMAISKQTIEGTKIINEVQSSNLVRTEYDTSDSSLVVEFKNGTKYSYENVPHKIYAQFRLAESQGNFFNTNIAKAFKYKKLT